MCAGEGLDSEVLVHVHHEARALIRLESAVFDAASIQDLSCPVLWESFGVGALGQRA